MMLFMKLIGPVLVLTISILKDIFPEKSKTHPKWKMWVLAIMVFATSVSAIVIVHDHTQGKKSANQIQKSFETQDQRAETRNNELKDQLNEVATKLRPFIEIAKQRYPQYETNNALNKLREDIHSHERELEAIRNYSEVSKWNGQGMTGKYNIDDFIETTKVSPYMEGTYEIKNNTLSYLCDDHSISKFKTVIEKFPNYPFSYVAMAKCLGRKGDPAFLNYVRKAKGIFEKTTLIDGHHETHDEMLKKLAKY